jgi:hypothetical protein
MKHVHSFLNESDQIKVGTFVRYKKDKEFTGGKVISIKGNEVEIHNWDGSTSTFPIKDLEYVKSWNESLNLSQMKRLHSFENFISEAISATEIKDKQKYIPDDPKLSEQISHFHDLQKEIKKIEEDLTNKKAEFKQFEEEIRPMLDCMKELNVKLALTEEFIIQVTRFGGERKDVSYKNAFENALTKVNAATKKVLMEALEAAKHVTQVKHSFNIEQLAEGTFIENVKKFLKSGIDAFLGLFKREEKKIDDANDELKKITAR